MDLLYYTHLLFMPQPFVSIVIRTLNERDRVKPLLDMIAAQEYDGEYEVIVVDNASTDGTAELARSYNAKVFTIPRNEFTYPKSMNLGVENASGELVVLTVGHALPFTKDWISSGVRHFTRPDVAGVFGPPIARKDASLFEKLHVFGYLKARLFGAHEATLERWPGIMGATNCMLRRSLWQQHPFDTRFAMGGEDVQWARWAIQEGYKIIVDHRFAVRHSHGNDLRGIRKQEAYWRSISKPTSFSKETLAFRKDLKIND